MKRPAGSLKDRDLRSVLFDLRKVNGAVARAYPGESGDRQPVHTVYGGAHLFRADSAAKLGSLAITALDEYAPDARSLERILGFDRNETGAGFAATIRTRIVDKLRREPVEDFRIDFEDGYGNRQDEEEDGHAQSAARQAGGCLDAGSLPPFIGIRIKPLSLELHSRSLRTLDLFVTELATATKKRLPPNFRVTIPKIMAPGQVQAVADTCTALE